MNSEPGGVSTNCGVEGGGEVMDAFDFPNDLNLIEYLNEEEEAGSSESNDGSSDAEESGEDDGQLQALYATLGSTFPSSGLFDNMNHQQQSGSEHPYAPINPQPSHTAAYGLHPLGLPPGFSTNRGGEFLAGPTQFAMAPPFHCQPTPGCFPPGYSQPVYLVPQPVPVMPHHQAGVPQLCTLMPHFYQHPHAAYAQAPVPSQTTPVLLAPPSSSHLHFHHQGQNHQSAINEVDIVQASLSCGFSSPPSRSNPSVPSTPSTPTNSNSMGCFQAPFGLSTYHATSHHPTTIPSSTSSTSTLFPIDVGVAQHVATGNHRHQLFTPFLPQTPAPATAPACRVGLPMRTEPSICGNNPQSAVSQSTIPYEQRVETTTSVMEPHAHHRIPVYLQAYRQAQPSIVGLPLAAGSTTENPATTTVPDVPLQGGVEQSAGGDAPPSSGGNEQEPGAGEGGDTIDAPAPMRSSKRKQQFPPPTSPPLTRGPPDAKRVFVLSSENLAAISSDPRTSNKIGGGKITVLRPVATPTPTTSTAGSEMIEAGQKERSASRKREMTSEALDPTFQLAINHGKSDGPGHAQTVQRIATPEGWDRMNEWLKAADQTKNTERLRALLSKCLEANVTIELLEKSKNDADNSLPKFVQQLSKRSKDSVVANLASQIVAKWKRVIKESGSNNNKAAPSSAPAAAKIVVPLKHHPQTEANILDQVQEEMDKSYSTAAGGPSSSATATAAATSSTTTTTTSQPRPSTRASTVKAKMSNRRLTGLEGDDDAIETSSSQQHASRRLGSNPHASASTSTPSYLAALRPASGQPTPAAPPGTSAKREHYKESSSFMDALNQQAATETAAKKSKIVRKKLGGTVATNKTTAAATITPTSSSGSFDTPTPVEGALQVDTSGNDMAGAVAAEQPTTSGSSSTAKNKRKKVSFVEGAKMVQVQYFIVEEGERVNVTKSSFEQKKQMDMKKESMDLSKTFSHSHSRIVTAMPMPPGFSPRHFPTTSSSSSRPWKLTPLDDVIEQIERGVNSQSKLIELERQKTALEAFYDWKIVCPISDLDEEDCPPHDLPEPPIIPLELKPEGEEDSATTSAAAGRQTHTSTASKITQLPLPPSATTTSGAVSTPSMAPSVYKKSPEQVVDAVSPASPAESSPSRQGGGGGRSAVRRLIPSHSSSASSSPSVVDVSSPEGPQSPEDTDIRHRVEAEGVPPANVPITATTTTTTNSRGGVNDPLELVNRLKQAGMMDSGVLRGVLNRIKQHNNESPSISGSSASAAIDSAASVSTSNKQEPVVGQGAVTGVTQAVTVLPLPSGSAAIATPTTIPQSGVFLNQLPSMSVPPPNIAGSGARPSAFVPATFPVPPPGYPLAVIPPQSNVFSSPPPTMHSGVQRSPAVVGRASAFSTPPNNNPTASAGGGAASSLPPPGLILSLPHIASNHHDSNNNSQQQARSIAAVNSSLPSSQTCLLSNTTATLHPPGLEGAVDSGPNRGGFSFPPTQQQSISSPSDPREQMPANRTFVKQCTFYQGGGCRFGEQCLYAHGEEMTIGVKQALAAVGSTSPPRSRGGFVGRGGRGGRFGGWGGGGRGGGGGGSGSQHGHLTAVGGGIEISYDEREDRVRAWQIPPTHVMVTSDRNEEDARGPSRFSVTRGGYRGRGGRGNFHSSSSHFDRYGGGRGGWQRRRSSFSSRSISPIRAGRRRSRSKSKSKSRSVSRSRSPRPPPRGRDDSNDERHRNSRSSWRRRSSRSPPARRDRRETEWKNKSPETAGTGGRGSKRRSNDNSASPTPLPREGKRRAVRRSRSPEPDRVAGGDGVANASAGGRASSSRWENEQQPQRRMSAVASEGHDNGGSRSSRSGSNPKHHAMLGEEIVIDCDDDHNDNDNSGPTSGVGRRTNSPPPSPSTRTGSRRRRSPSASSSSSSSGASSTDE